MCLLTVLSSAISTHTPHARRDSNGFSARQQRFGFQLTRLMRGVTFLNQFKNNLCFIFQLTRLMRGVTTFFCTVKNK